MKKWIQKNKWIIAGALVGAIGGYFYYAQVGCISGTCAITSNPVNSTAYFALVGALAGSALKKETVKTSVKNHEPTQQ